MLTLSKSPFAVAMVGKAKDQAGRFSFTDYFDDQAARGSKGQTKRVYDPKHASFTLDTGITPPSGTAEADFWKYQLVLSTPNNHSAEFAYDENGRPIDVWKLQKATTTPWTYVQTHTTYGSDNDGSWGQASEVVEDYGVGKINRKTTTNDYTSWGKACDVTDAAERRFFTLYDLDGNVLSVTRTDTSPEVPVATYTYGSSGVSNGMVTSVTDNLSNVVQTISYSSTAGGSLGQVSSVAESRGGSLDNTVSYTYTTAGDRATAAYATPSGTTKWQYADYVSVGDPSSLSRAFQTLRQVSASTGNPLAEEFHYSYDSAGRLTEAAFAQTPKGGFTPTGSNPWYDASNRASTRARAHYEYDPAGRLVDVAHSWDAWNGSSYSSEAVLTNSNTYELSGSNRGMKTASGTSYRTATGGAWTLLQSASYGYDASLDTLTSETIGGTTTNWSYDAAGNRNDTVADNLNRPTSIGGISVTSDILGNRLTKGSNVSYGWDVLNRMTSYTSGSIATSYVYRADGMRVSKSDSTGSAVYRYDGQMAVQDVETTSTSTIVNDYALGARGVDAVSKTDSSGTAVGYPIYDGHGNRVATLTKSGSSFALGDLRSYDAWGNVLTGGSTGRPRGRYVANLGHVQDDESSLIYMRARYYEPASGRFVSEDTARDGQNWYVYCLNNPVSFVDESGNSPLSKLLWNLFALAGGMAGAAALLEGSLKVLMGRFSSALILISGAAMLVAYFNLDHQRIGDSGDRTTAFAVAFLLMTAGPALAAVSSAGKGGVAGEAVSAVAAYIFVIATFMALDAVEESAYEYYGSTGGA